MLGSSSQESHRLDILQSTGTAVCSCLPAEGYSLLFCPLHIFEYYKLFFFKFNVNIL